MAKNRTRFDYTSLAEVLSQQGVADAEILNAALKASAAAGIPFPEILLTQDLITDRELSRQVCKLYGLPFMPIDFYPPSEEAVKAVPADFIRQHRLIPVGVHGNLLTVSMPALVPAEVLGEIAALTDMHIQPMVGTVQSNGLWILTNLPEHIPAALPRAGAIPDYATSEGDSGWSNLFDEGDASVLMDLGEEVTSFTVPELPSDELDELDAFGELQAIDELGSEVMVLTDDSGDTDFDDSVALPELPPLPNID